MDLNKEPERQDVIAVPSNSSTTVSNDPEAVLVTEKTNETITSGSSSDPLFIEGKRILQEEDIFEQTAPAFSERKKWFILWIVAVVQTSMNYNAAVYSNAVGPLNHHYNTNQARYGMMAFLLAYAFGCELWAPWSEELGRWPIMQLSLFLVNVWQVLCGASTAWPQVLVGRILGGLSSAGGSVTLGMVADMWDSEDQQHAVAFVALWSCLGSVVGGVCGGAIEQYLPWRWNFWIQLIFGAIVQLLHFLCVPETRSTTIVEKEAKRRRKAGTEQIYAVSELQKFSWKEAAQTMYRPYHMLLTEPIVLFLSLLSGFSDALIFSFLESFAYVFYQWHFSTVAMGLAMFSLLIGYVLAYFSFFPTIRRHNFWRKGNYAHKLTPESRLWWLLYLAPLLPFGLLCFAFVSTGPPIPWIAPLIFTCLIGMANYAIYFATVDYMVAAYGVYAASATGGNGFMRDLLAGLCVSWTRPLYKNLKPKSASLLLFGIALLVCIPVYIFYFYGPFFRTRSKFAQELQAEKQKTARRRTQKRDRAVARAENIEVKTLG